MCTCTDKIFQMFPTGHVLAEAGSPFSSCVILLYDKFHLKTPVKMPFVPLPKQADLRSVIGFYLEYMTLCRKSQSIEKDKCCYSDEVGRGLSVSAATGAARSWGRQHCLSVRNGLGLAAPPASTARESSSGLLQHAQALKNCSINLYPFF